MATKNKDRAPPVELQWIEEEPAQGLVKPPLDDFEYVEERNFSNTIWKKTRQNLFVPLGLIATTACLTLGLLNLRRGDSKKQQFYMRGRVGFQAFTLAAMTLGAAFTGSRMKKDTKT